jgi:cobaltochelatase CobS
MTTHNETQVACRINAGRGSLCFADMAQEAKHPAKLELRKWLSANGVPSAVAARLSFSELENAWNDESNAALFALGQRPAAPVETIEDQIAMTVKQNHAAPVAAPADPLAGLMAYINAHVAGSVNEDRVRAIVEEALSGVKPREVIVQGPVHAVRIAERTNKVFDRVVKLAAKNRNIMLVGPAGCGKTTLAQQIAKALNRKFGMIQGSAGASEAQLIGRLLPSNGGAFEYRSSPFVDLYEGGEAVFLLDEFDAFDANMLLTANAATANGFFTIDIRHGNTTVTRGENVTIIATANTFGTGADPVYSGRNQLDGATLDRFKIIEMDYDRDLEMEIGTANGIGKSQMADFFALRDKVAKAGLLRIVGTRTLLRIIDDMECGLTFDAAMQDVAVGWAADERQRVGL